MQYCFRTPQQHVCWVHVVLHSLLRFKFDSFIARTWQPETRSGRRTRQLLRWPGEALHVGVACTRSAGGAKAGLA